MSMWRWTKANILCRVRLRSGAAYQCKRDAASCINKFKANIDQGEFPERSKHHVASCVNGFRVRESDSIEQGTLTVAVSFAVRI